MGSEQLESSEHFDFWQQESRDCWGVESLDAVGWNILVRLPEALAETAAKLDRTQVPLKA
jgi:hypothetical protein